MTETARTYIKYRRYVQNCADNGYPPPLASQAPPKPSDREIELETRKMAREGERAEEVRAIARAKGIRDAIVVEQLASIVPPHVDVSAWLDECLRQKPDLIPAPKPVMPVMTHAEQVAYEQGSLDRQQERMRNVTPEMMHAANERAGITDYIPPAPMPRPQDPDVMRAKLPPPLTAKQQRYLNDCTRMGLPVNPRTLKWAGESR